AADALELLLGAAMGRDPRFDVIYPGGASFASERDAYRELIAGGGSLKAAPRSRAQPPGLSPAAGEGGPRPPPAASAPPARPGASGARWGGSRRTGSRTARAWRPAARSPDRPATARAASRPPPRWRSPRRTSGPTRRSPRRPSARRRGRWRSAAGSAA